MKKLLFMSLCGAIILTAARPVIAAGGNQQPIEVKISEVEFGLFNVNSLEKVGSRLPVYDTTEYINTHTDTMPIKKHMAFGSRFRADADRGRVLQLLTVWSTPTLDEPGKTEQVRRKSTIGRAENHETLQFSYRLDHEWEMQPGAWTLQVFLVGVDKEKVKSAEELVSSPYWVELYRKTFTLEE